MIDRNREVTVNMGQGELNNFPSSAHLIENLYPLDPRQPQTPPLNRMAVVIGTV